MKYAIMGKKTWQGCVGSFEYERGWICLKISSSKSEAMAQTIKLYLQDLGYYLKETTGQGGNFHTGGRMITTSRLSRHYNKKLKSEKTEAKS
jgi:hypothetical protein